MGCSPVTAVPTEGFPLMAAGSGCAPSCGGAGATRVMSAQVSAAGLCAGTRQGQTVHKLLLPVCPQARGRRASPAVAIMAARASCGRTIPHPWGGRGGRARCHHRGCRRRRSARLKAVRWGEGLWDEGTAAGEAQRSGHPGYDGEGGSSPKLAVERHRAQHTNCPVCGRSSALQGDDPWSTQGSRPRAAPRWGDTRSEPLLLHCCWISGF